MGRKEREEMVPWGFCLSKGNWLNKPGLVWGVLGWRCLKNIQVMCLAVSLESRRCTGWLIDFSRQPHHQC